MRRFRYLSLLATLCVFAAVVGCRNPLARSKAAASHASIAEEGSDISLVSASDKQPMTFLDSEHLRYGTGKIDDDATMKFNMTSSGLRYRVLRESKGRKATAQNTVTVNYRGWLDSGKEFDSSYDGQPISFPLNGVIKGWTEGMQLVGEGGMIELWIPAGLGYGAQGSGRDVPPNATLHFIVELLSVR
ncbi:MAG: FKBP-type peptidyl-prolyl cis-trans isomerase [Fuerstiella sp.]